jgi:hypothetical protein
MRHNRGVALRAVLSTMAAGSHMRHSSKQILACGWLCAAVLSAACGPRRIPPMTVEDLMEDRVALDGLLMKCNEDPSKVRNISDCANARIASERLASQQVDPNVEKRRQEEFEKAREQLRLAQDKQRQEQEAKAKVDAYTLPVVPVEPAPKSNPPATLNNSPAAPSPAPTKNDSPPLAGTTTP